MLKRKLQQKETWVCRAFQKQTSQELSIPRDQTFGRDHVAYSRRRHAVRVLEQQLEVITSGRTLFEGSL